MEKYENLGMVGEGSYGMVIKCKHKESGQTVAIKKFLESEDDKMVKKIAMREVRMLRKLRHENLVNLIEVFRRRKRLYLVFEFVDHTILDDLEKYPKGLAESAVQKILWQVLRAVGFIHSHNIIHRDIKPENILHSRTGLIKLCDFGFARTLASPGEIYTDYVATRWYRAPELLVGDTKYGRAVDIWAIGCLVIEMLTGDPLFPGDSDIDQLYQIMRCFGNLCPRHREVFYRNPLFAGMRLPEIREFKSLEKRYTRFSNEILDLMKKCMSLDPNDRPSATNLLSHQFFHRHNFNEKILPELRRQIHKENLNNGIPSRRENIEKNSRGDDYQERTRRKKLMPKDGSQLLTKSKSLLIGCETKDKQNKNNKEDLPVRNTKSLEEATKIKLANDKGGGQQVLPNSIQHKTPSSESQTKQQNSDHKQQQNYKTSTKQKSSPQKSIYKQQRYKPDNGRSHTDEPSSRLSDRSHHASYQRSMLPSLVTNRMGDQMDTQPQTIPRESFIRSIHHNSNFITATSPNHNNKKSSKSYSSTHNLVLDHNNSIVTSSNNIFSIRSEWQKTLQPMTSRKGTPLTPSNEHIKIPPIYGNVMTPEVTVFPLQQANKKNILLSSIASSASLSDSLFVRNSSEKPKKASQHHTEAPRKEIDKSTMENCYDKLPSTTPIPTTCNKHQSNSFDSISNHNNDFVEKLNQEEDLLEDKKTTDDIASGNSNNQLHGSDKSSQNEEASVKMQREQLIGCSGDNSITFGRKRMNEGTPL